MSITASAAAASTALAAFPGDVTSPIAEQIMEISGYLLVVVCALVLEKSLLMIIGFISFNIIIPIACGILCVYVVFNKQTLKTLALKLIVFAVILVTIIPISVKFGDMIYDVNMSTVDQVTSDISEELNEIENVEEQTWFDKVLGSIKEGVSNVGEKAKELLNKFIDAIAVFVIAYCAMPIIAFIVVLWLVKLLFGLEIPVSSIAKKMQSNIRKTVKVDRDDQPLLDE